MKTLDGLINEARWGRNGSSKIWKFAKRSKKPASRISLKTAGKAVAGGLAVGAAVKAGVHYSGRISKSLKNRNLRSKIRHQEKLEKGDVETKELERKLRQVSKRRKARR